MLGTILGFIAQNWLILVIVITCVLALCFIKQIVALVLLPFKVVWFVLKYIFIFFKWLFGLFKKPFTALSRTKRAGRP